MSGLFASLLLVAGVTVLGVRLLLRRERSFSGAPGRFPLRVLQHTATGPRHGVVLLRVGERVLVVGVAEHGMSLLTELTENAAVEAITARATLATPGMLGTRWRSLLHFGLVCTLMLAAAHTAAAQQPASVSGVRSAPPRATGGVARPLLGAPTVAAPAAVAPVPARRASRPVARTTVAPVPFPHVQLQVDNGGDGFKVSGAVGLVMFIGSLTLLPALVLLTTSFTRVVIVLQFLRTGLGTQSAPPMQLLVAIALLITGLVMRPTLDAINAAALQPLKHGKISQEVAYDSVVQPLRRFMLANLRDQDLAAFAEMSGADTVAAVDSIPTVTVMSAFVTSELRTSFQMGFVILLPFVVVDLLVAAVLTSMGMFMLPPQMVALPLKLLLFVLADGWILMVKSLVSSFHT
jgi:flagellar biosynthetic protein FliP